jgi:membrane protein CcdC involved in cytochrome C biogenesis
MPHDDGLPSYEEATGWFDKLPAEISSNQITRQISRQTGINAEDDEEDTCWNLILCIVLITVLPISIVMISVGASTLDSCPDSLLPTWMMACGVFMFSPYLSFCFPKCSESLTGCFYLVLLSIIFVYCCIGVYQTIISYIKEDCDMITIWLSAGSLVILFLFYLTGLVKCCYSSHQEVEPPVYVMSETQQIII